MNLVYDATGNLLKTEPGSSLGKGTAAGKKSGSTTPETETR
jgi:hypothetical protein